MELDPIQAFQDHVPAAPPPPAPTDPELTSSSSSPRNGDAIPSHDGAAATASASASSRVESTRELSEDPLASLLGTSHDTDAPSASHAKSSSTSTAKVAPRKIIRNAPLPEELNEELGTLLLQKQLPQSSVSALQNLLRENTSLKEKNGKLKSLLGRSAKAQRDAKNDLEQMKKAYEGARADADRLEKRVEVLANRPTHMDLLADFETNFDRALLSIGDKRGAASQQSGGENAAESSSAAALVPDDGHEGLAPPSLYDDHGAVPAAAFSRPHGRVSKDSLLLTELAEAKARIAHLESLNGSFQSRYNALEHARRLVTNEQQASKNMLTNVQLELRMSKMETDHLMRGLREQEAVVAEMQLEIDLVTQSAVEANKRAAEGREVLRDARRDGAYVDGLEAKVVALQEWALASTESKRLTMERCMGLEGRVQELEGAVRELTASQGGAAAAPGDAVLLDGERAADPLAGAPERTLWSRTSSLVVGAGLAGHVLFRLGPAPVAPSETVVLRWRFDLTPGDLDIHFSVL